MSVTEIAGDEVSQEQVQRIYNRYYWAGPYCKNKDVLEVACGTGQGLGYLAKLSRSIKAGDYSNKILNIAREHYGNRIDFIKFDAQNMPFPNDSFDVIIMFEAIYYLPNADNFILECNRVLRPGGKVLLATANKDLFDFSPSPYSYKYYGTCELYTLFSEKNFFLELYGDTPVDNLSLRQKLLRPIKKLATELNLIPKTMKGKRILKKIMFGNLVKMPAEIIEGMNKYMPPMPISHLKPDTRHKVIYCAATLND